MFWGVDLALTNVSTNMGRTAQDMQAWMKTICSFLAMVTEHTVLRVSKCQILCAGEFELANFAQNFDNQILQLKAQKY